MRWRSKLSVTFSRSVGGVGVNTGSVRDGPRFHLAQFFQRALQMKTSLSRKTVTARGQHRLDERSFGALREFWMSDSPSGEMIALALLGQGVPRLVENGVARHQPQHHRAVGAHEFPHRQPHRVAGEQRLSTARRHAQTDVRHRRFQTRR